MENVRIGEIRTIYCTTCKARTDHVFISEVPKLVNFSWKCVICSNKIKV